MSGGFDANMSEGEYQLMYGDPSFDEDDPPPSLEEPTGSWRTRDGRALKIRKMTDKHIQSVIELFDRAGWGHHSKINELRRELERRKK